MKMSKKTPSYVIKYFFARGYADRVQNIESEAPCSEVNDYYIEITGVNVVDQYNEGYAAAEKDRVNGIV